MNTLKKKRTGSPRAGTTATASDRAVAPGTQMGRGLAAANMQTDPATMTDLGEAMEKHREKEKVTVSDTQTKTSYPSATTTIYKQCQAAYDTEEDGYEKGQAHEYWDIYESGLGAGVGMGRGGSNANNQTDWGSNYSGNGNRNGIAHGCGNGSGGGGTKCIGEGAGPGIGRGEINGTGDVNPENDSFFY